MSFETSENNSADRRGFIKRAGAGLTAGLLASTATSAQSAATPEPVSHAGVGRALSDKEKLERIASNTWPIRYIF